jgi:hypothetical protein
MMERSRLCSNGALDVALSGGLQVGQGAATCMLDGTVRSEKSALGAMQVDADDDPN